MIYSINTLLWSDTVDENLIPIIEQIHAVGYSGIESMTLAPRVLLTATGTAATVPSTQPENTATVTESADNGIEL